MGSSCALNKGVGCCAASLLQEDLVRQLQLCCLENIPTTQLEQTNCSRSASGNKESDHWIKLKEARLKTRGESFLFLHPSFNHSLNPSFLCEELCLQALTLSTGVQMKPHQQEDGFLLLHLSEFL